jgi:integrase
MRRGNKSIHPGIRPDGKNGFVVRMTLRNEEGLQKEREQRVKGTLTEAIRVREDLREELLREFADEAKLRELGLERANARKEILMAYAVRWLDHVEKSGRNRKHVVEQHTEVIERFILPRLGRMEVGQITRRDVVMWMEGLGDLKTKKGEPYAKQTLANVWGTLRCMLKDALVLCNLKEDVTAGIRFRVRGKEAIEKDVLTRDELGRLLDATQGENPDMRAMIWVGFTTGMRFGELSALQWDDIDFAGGLIHVRKSQVKGNVGPTKTRSRRTVPLHPVVAEMLHAHAKWQQDRRIPGRESGFLFLPTKTRTTGDGDGAGSGGALRLRYSNVLSKPLARCAEKAKVNKHVTPHTMPRTFNNLARQAAGEIVARSMTGHTTTAMTEHYSHVTLEEKNRALSVALGLLETAPVVTTSAGVHPSKTLDSPQQGENVEVCK